MAPSATATQSLSSKIKRPVPPGIQTNGINSSTSSPSPSMSAGRLPSAAKYPPNSAANNGAGSTTSGPRSANRSRRETPAQLLGRGQRNSSVGLRSGSIAGDSGAVQASEPMPYVKSDEYILKKYRGNVPSLIIHLHPTFFRFDQQEGSFTYKSPMRIVIEHLRQRTIPHDLIEFLDVPFYEGCMIVQIYDHKSTAPSQNSNRSNTGAGKTVPFSVHNYTTFVTPSPYVPYPTQPLIPGRRNGQADGENDESKSKSAEQKDKENMPAPAVPGDGQRNKQPRKPKISTIVLHPTPLSHHFEFVAKAADAVAQNEGRRDSAGGPLSATVPPTPNTAVPSTPSMSMAPPAKRLKKGKSDLDSANIYSAESHITFATTSALVLDPVTNANESAALLKALAHPMHLGKPPSPKSRKRTVAEVAADEALAADQERYMLTLDERLSSNAAGVLGANPADGNGQAGSASFEPRFERFKALENIRNNLEEKSRLDKLRKEEAERKAAQDRERDKLRMEAEKREQEKARNTMAIQQQQQQQQQQQEAAIRRQQQHEAQLRAQQAQQAQQAQGMQGIPPQVQGQHAHPQANGMMPNGMQGQPQRFHQQQVSQSQVSSPIVRNGTPQNHSSPMNNNMGNVPMQQSTSSMGGSPPRPGSVVHQNHPPMGAPTPHGMTAQRSQQSHAGTPRMPNSTPNIQNTPLNRQMSQTSRMSQGSPLQGQMAQAPQVAMMPNGQPMILTQQQSHALQQQRLQAAQAAQAAQAMRQQTGVAMGGMINGQQVSPQAFMQAQIMQQQQQRTQQQGMAINPMAQNYAAQMAAMAARSGGIPQNMNQHFMNGNPNMQQQMNHQQVMNFQMQQRQQAQLQQQQQNPQQQQQQQGHANQQQIYAQQVLRLSQVIYQKELPNFQARFPGGIPEENERHLRAHSHQQATTQVQANMRARRQMQQQAQQQQMMAQGGMQQNMNGMPNSMGM